MVFGMSWYMSSELVQLKLNIEASDGDSTPPEVYEESTPTYRSGGLENQIKNFTFTLPTSLSILSGGLLLFVKKYNYIYPHILFNMKRGSTGCVSMWGYRGTKRRYCLS